MTIRIKSAPVQPESGLSECGKSGCVVIYTGDNCAFCDGAREVVINALADFGANQSVISEVNISSGVECACDLPGIVTLPTIRICEHLISGIPQMDDVRSHLMHAILKGCFPF